MSHGGGVKNYNAIIVGGGMTGLAAATALGRQKLKVAVIDRDNLQSQQLPEFDGRVSAISLGSRHILENLGAWGNMLPHAQPILDIRVHEAGGFGHVHYDHKTVGDDPMGHIIENRHIRSALLSAVAAQDSVTVHAPTQWETVEFSDNSVSLNLSNGQTIAAPLLIAADGKFSKLREKMKLPVIKRDYEQTAIVATIKHSQPHQGVALERFFTQGPFAVLPMKGNRASLVWVEAPATAKAICALPSAQVLPYLQEKMQGYLGEVELDSQLWSYPLTAVMAKDAVAQRSLLLGDSAHAIHPIAGQGVNLGFRDVAVLDEIVAEAKKLGQDIGANATLAKYQQWRRFDTAAMLGATDGLNNLFSNNNTAVSLIRNSGFALVNQWPSVRDTLMKHAMGTQGDLPNLSKSVG